MSIYQHLEDLAASVPDKPALIEVKHSGAVAHIHSYAELLARADEYTSGFLSSGVKPGDRILMLMKPDFEWVAIGFALLRIGAVPVFIDPKIGFLRLLKCIQRADATHMVGESIVYLLSRLAQSKFASIRQVFVRDPLPLGSSRSIAQVRKASRKEPRPSSPTSPLGEDAVCLIAYTSGSTGTPKGVEWSRLNVLTQIREFHRAFGTSDEDTNLCTLPFFAIIGIAIGTTSVLPDMDFGSPGSADPAHILDIIQRYKITYGFGSPALWSNVANYCHQHDKTIDPLRVAITGGAAISPYFVSQARKAIPQGEVLITYGATEALLIASVAGVDFLDTYRQASNDAHQGVYVGQPIANTVVRIIKIKDKAISSLNDKDFLPAGTIGEVIVRGPVVSQGYLLAPQATQMAKIPQSSSDDSLAATEATRWHRTGDAGYLDEQGGLWLCGRLTHRTYSNDRAFYPLCVEKIFSSHHNVARCCLVNCSTSNGFMGRLWGRSTRAKTKLGLVIEGQSQHEDRISALTLELFKLAHQHNLPIEFIAYYPQSFPVDRRHNAKVDRTKIASWAQSHHCAWHPAQS